MTATSPQKRAALSIAAQREGLLADDRIHFRHHGAGLLKALAFVAGPPAADLAQTLIGDMSGATV